MGKLNQQEHKRKLGNSVRLFRRIPQSIEPLNESPLNNNEAIYNYRGRKMAFLGDPYQDSQPDKDENKTTRFNR